MADVASLSPVGGLVSSQRGLSKHTEMLSREGDKELLSMQSGKVKSDCTGRGEP